MARMPLACNTAIMPEPGTRARLVPWSAMTLSSSVIASSALLVLHPDFRPPFVAERRAALPIALVAHLAGVPFHDAYLVVSWACRVPNLIVAEWWILAPHHREATA